MYETGKIQLSNRVFKISLKGAPSIIIFCKLEKVGLEYSNINIHLDTLSRPRVPIIATIKMDKRSENTLRKIEQNDAALKKLWIGSRYVR